MATIHLDNLINPRQTNASNTVLSKEPTKYSSTYTDLHLDLAIENNAGNGLNSQQSSDILVDNDVQAIKNSLYNIFSTLPGQKLLTPSFGASLMQYLFEPVDNIRAKIIGNNILKAISTFEPRINVVNIQVTPQPDQYLYYIVMIYQLVGLNFTHSAKIVITNNDISIS